MKRYVGFVLFVAFGVVSPAHADMFCVQRGLANLGYTPGTVDGVFGNRTAGAAVEFATDFAIDLPPLTRNNSADWCPVVADALASSEGIARRFDIVSRPAGVLSQSQTQALWNAYKTAPECFEHPTYGAGTSYGLDRFRAGEWAGSVWQSPYTQAIGAKACTVPLVNFSRTPAPLPAIVLDEAYGNSQIAAAVATDWFLNAATYVRLTGDPVARIALKGALLDWARAGGFGRGINVSWGSRPVDYEIIAGIMALASATAEVIPNLSAEDKAVLGPWLNDLVARVADSRWKDRQDNKAYMKSYLALIWGIMVGDDAAVQQGIDVYKLAIHDMRPDGSFPIDSQRSGMGIQYNATAASHLVQMAAALHHNFGLDLFSYEVDGRSGHTMVDFVVRSIKDPSATNRLYAISCPGGGDRWGDIDRPSTSFIDDASYLLLYADMFPQGEHAAFINDRLAGALVRAQIPEHTGGAPACLFAQPTGGVFEGETIVFEVPAELPQAALDVRVREELAHRTGNAAEVNSMFRGGVMNGRGQELDFNIRAFYRPADNSLGGLVMTINVPLGATRPSALGACGYVTTQVYDDGEHRLNLAFDQSGTVFTARNLDCLSGAVGDPASAMMALLTENFRDIAIGMVNQGTVDMISHNGLRQWITDVAEGRVVVQASKP